MLRFYLKKEPPGKKALRGFINPDHTKYANIHTGREKYTDVYVFMFSIKSHI